MATSQATQLALVTQPSHPAEQPALIPRQGWNLILITGLELNRFCGPENENIAAKKVSQFDIHSFCDGRDES